jgi:hypothetical protein
MMRPEKHTRGRPALRHSDAAARLRSDIAHLEARYDSGAVPPAIYAVLKKLRQELSELALGDGEGQ